MWKMNTDYTKALWQWCSESKIPFIYASSGATYGRGDEGYSDDHRDIPKYKPLNVYGRSKHEFDLWALKQKAAPPRWYGLKFFNVYGMDESHKGRMASPIFHGYNEIQKAGKQTLFRSHKEGVLDGEQKRDFILICEKMFCWRRWLFVEFRQVELLVENICGANSVLKCV